MKLLGDFSIHIPYGYCYCINENAASDEPVLTVIKTAARLSDYTDGVFFIPDGTDCEVILPFRAKYEMNVAADAKELDFDLDGFLRHASENADDYTSDMGFCFNGQSAGTKTFGAGDFRREYRLVNNTPFLKAGYFTSGLFGRTTYTTAMITRHYKKGADGEPEIIPSEAAIVERIFNLYLAGETVDKISKMMQAENYDIPGKTISFSKGMIMNMLSNERYCGDAILQKSVTIDCIEKKRKKNTGEAPMYYVQNNHPAIIDRVIFNKVQEELARRKTKTPGSAKSSITSTGKYSRYALTDVLICGNCGTRYRRVTWSRNGVKRIVWRCISRLDYGKKYCSDSPTIMEDKLQQAIVRAVNKFNEQDNATYKALMKATISEALGLDGDSEEVDMLERKIEALNNKMLALVNESVISGEGIEAHESEFMTLSQETELLKQRIAAIQESAARDDGEQNRLEQIQAIIAERESKCMEYDDSIVRQMVECIKVYPGGKLEIIFGGGYLVEETV